MPIPTRSGPVQPPLSQEERLFSKVTYKPTIKVNVDSATGTKNSSGGVESSTEAHVSRLKPPNTASYTVSDKLRSSKLTLPETHSSAASATQHVELDEASKVGKDVSKIPEHPTVLSSSLPLSQTTQLSSTAVKQAAAGRGHSRQQSVVISKPRSVPTGHKRATSTITSQPSKAGNTEASRIRPDFNNFQQNFSPKKARPNVVMGPDLKPHLAENSGTHLQRSLLENELLQLQLVHKDADKTLRSFQESADRHLENLQQSLLLKETEVLGLESQHQRQLSLQALDNWLKMPSELSEDQKVQRLSEAVDELARLEKLLWKPDGLLRVFEEWQNVARAVILQRELDDIPDQVEMVFSLGAEWNDSMSQTKEKVLTNLRVLQALKPDRFGSGISTLVVSHTKLAESLVGEMEMAMKIERKISEQENEWIRLEIDNAVQDYGREKGVNHQRPWNDA